MPNGEFSFEPEEFIRLNTDLAATRAELDVTTEIRATLASDIETLNARLAAEQTARTAAETQVTTLAQQVETLQGEVTESTGTLQELQNQLRTQEGELGALRTVAARAETLETDLAGLRTERDLLQQKIVDVQTRAAEELAARLGEWDERLPARIEAAVTAALAQIRHEQETERAAWGEERKTLRAQLDEAKAAAAAAAEKGPSEVAAKDLAQQFLDVFNDLAAPRPEAGRQFGAALTNLEVEAKVGIAQVQTGADVSETLLRPVDPTAALPDTLSTVRMRFGLLPRMVREEGE